MAVNIRHLPFGVVSNGVRDWGAKKRVQASEPHQQETYLLKKRKRGDIMKRVKNAMFGRINAVTSNEDQVDSRNYKRKQINKVERSEKGSLLWNARMSTVGPACFI